MRLEWDELKSRLNQRKHGVAFSLAARVFADECRTLEKTGSMKKRASSGGTRSGELAVPQYTSWSTFIGERKMEKKSSGSSRRGTLTSVKAQDIFNKPLTTSWRKNAFSKKSALRAGQWS